MLDSGNSVFNKTGFTNKSYASSTVHAFHRSNLDRKLLKRGNYYMIDSTYLIASNPNTMRDQGPWRNAEYYFVPWSELDDMAAMRNTYQTSSTQSPVGKTFSKNKDGYSFGGKTKYGNLNHHQSAYKGLADSSPGYYMTNNKWSKSTDESTQKVYREYSQKSEWLHKEYFSRNL